MSDAVLLIPIQVTMLASITFAFGLDVPSGTLATLVTAAAGTTATTMVGKALVANLLKMFPGAGTLVGGAIAGTTAAILTTSLGKIYMATLEKLFVEFKGEGITPEAIEREFKKQLGGGEGFLEVSE